MVFTTNIPRSIYYFEVYLLNDTPGERKAISLVNCYVALLYSRHWYKALIEADTASVYYIILLHKTEAYNQLQCQKGTSTTPLVFFLNR